MTKFTALILFVFFSLQVSSQSIWRDAQKPRLVTGSARFGDYYYLKSKGKGLVVCFHGRGGSGKAWATKSENSAFLNNLKREGFGFLCPSALGKKWLSRGGAGSKDLVRVDSLLSTLGEKKGDIFLVGHSNGGGFASFYSVFSRHRARFKGVQFSNSSGIDQILEHRSYSHPTLFVGASCDQVASFKGAQRNYRVLKSKKPWPVKTNIEDLKLNYKIGGSKNCHEFLDSSTFFLNFFIPQIKNGDQFSSPINGQPKDRR